MEEENPRISANLRRIAFRYPDSHTSFRRVRGIRQRPAERLTRASGARREERGEERNKHDEKAYTRIIQYSLEDSSPDTEYLYKLCVPIRDVSYVQNSEGFPTECRSLLDN